MPRPNDNLPTTSWASRPFVRLVVPLMAGILLQAYLGIELELFAIMTFIGLIALIAVEQTRSYEMAYSLRYLHAPLVVLIMCGLGGMAAEISYGIDEETHFATHEGTIWCQAEVMESVSPRKNSYRTVVEVDQMRVSSDWVPASGEILLYLEKDSLAAQLTVGDVLLFERRAREMEPPANPGEFDFKGYLAKKNIHHQQYCASGLWRHTASRWRLKRVAENIRQTLIRTLEAAQLEGDELAIATALILGSKDRLSTDLMEAYSSAGAMHVLAVSGLHVGILFTMLGYMLIRLDRTTQGVIIKATVMILALWLYAFVTGLSPSVVRASAMFTAVLLGKVLRRQSNIYNNIASSAFVLLVIEPYYMFQVGFQLSYLAVLGIIYLQPKIKSLLHFTNRPARWAWEITCVSIAAQIATFPLAILYFHKFPVYFLLSNFLVIPAAGLILYLGITYFLIGSLPFVGEWVAALLRVVIQGMNAGVRAIEALPLSTLSGIDISVVEAITIYLITAAITVYFVHFRHRALIIALALVTGLSIWQVAEWSNFQQHDYLVVYDVGRDSAVNLVSHDYNILLCDSVLAADMGTQDFKLQGNWDRHAAPAPTFSPDTCPSSGFKKVAQGLYAIGDNRLAVVDSPECLPRLEGAVALDFLVLSYYRGMRMDKILDTYSPEMLIMDGSIGSTKASELSKYIPDTQRTHIVARDGFFETRLD